jgi:hypothetical protein
MENHALLMAIARAQSFVNVTFCFMNVGCSIANVAILGAQMHLLGWLMVL